MSSVENPLLFLYTGWLIAIPTMDFDDPQCNPIKHVYIYMYVIDSSSRKSALKPQARREISWFRVYPRGT